MAATLTDELTRVSVAEIEKWDEADGTVYVYGRCTTPEVDTDDQVVDSGWSGPALKEYLATAPTVRVQHNPQRDPAGSAVRVDVNRDGDGAHWLKAAVDEPIAQRLVKRRSPPGLQCRHRTAGHRAGREREGARRGHQGRQDR